VALAALVVGAWSGVPASRTAGHAGAPSQGKSLTVLEWAAGFGMWPDLDPATAPTAGSEAWYFDAIDGQLFDQGRHGNLLPDLATGYEFVNGKTFTIYLRRGVTFSDGTPFNAQGSRTTSSETLPHKTPVPASLTFLWRRSPPRTTTRSCST
jgi:peptide/nickel transport system substrate-binding protein